MSDVVTALKWCGTTIDVLLLIPESSWWFILCSSVRSRIDAAIQLLQYFFCIMCAQILVLVFRQRVHVHFGCCCLRVRSSLMSMDSCSEHVSSVNVVNV
jgi:hypothetical protein